MDFDRASKTSMQVKSQLEKLGYLIEHDKCHWTPTQTIDWLRYTWDTESGKIFVKSDRIDRLELKDRNLMKEVANIEGQFISMQQVIGDEVGLKTTAIYDSQLGLAFENNIRCYY